MKSLLRIVCTLFAFQAGIMKGRLMFWEARISNGLAKTPDVLQICIAKGLLVLPERRRLKALESLPRSKSKIFTQESYEFLLPDSHAVMAAINPPM